MDFLPGFINITLDAAFVAEYLRAMNEQEKLGVEMPETAKKIIVDYGGANVAKPLHVGHLRSAVIGEAIRRIEVFAGHDVISDVHFGDWGTQMGMILGEIILHDGDLSKTTTYNIDEISNFYKQANARCKEDMNKGYFLFICIFFHFFRQCLVALSPPWLNLLLNILLFLMLLKME